MVVDTSAVVAILFDEPERGLFVSTLARSPRNLIAAPNALECSIVLKKRWRPESFAFLDKLFDQLRLEIVPFSSELYKEARDAYVRFGKGAHPARLNFGDVCAYALAQAAQEPLLFKGDDFSQTDVRSAV